MYYVAVVCAHRGVAMPEGYSLSQEERQTIASQLTGIPITVQHANVKERIAGIPASKSLTPALMQETLDSCGLVIAAWVQDDGAVMAIFFVNNQCKRVIDLIAMGQLSSVSLTHVESTSQPVELTLCTIPARPGSKIVFSSPDLKEAYAYKARAELRSTSKNMETSTAPAKTPLEQILDGLQPEERKLVEARFTQMMEAVDKARSEKSVAEEKMATLQKMTEVDQKLMKTHLDQWRSAIQGMEGMEAQLQTYGLAVSESGQDVALDVLKEAPRMIQNTVSNIIKCASASMMANRAAPPRTPAMKRKAVEMSAPEEAAPASAGMDEDAMPACSALERAMAAQFN